MANGEHGWIEQSGEYVRNIIALKTSWYHDSVHEDVRRTREGFRILKEVQRSVHFRQRL